MKLGPLRSGFIPLGRWWRVSVRLHWSAPVLAVLFGRLRLAPGLWLGVLLLPLLHELGHAWLIHRSHRRVLRLDLAVFGGICAWRGEVARLRRSVIAWGGPLVQSVVLLVAMAARWRWPFAGHFEADLYDALIWVNLGTLAINLLPLWPFDGYDAWQLVPLLWHRHRLNRVLRTLTDQKQRELETLAADLEEDRLSPDLKRQLDRLSDEVQAKTELNRS